MSPAAIATTPARQQPRRALALLKDVSIREHLRDHGLLAAEQEGAINKTIWDSYISLAKAIAKAVMADATLKSKFMTCTPEGDGAECLASTIVDFGARAYRRPLNAEEIADFTSRRTSVNVPPVPIAKFGGAISVIRLSNVYFNKTRTLAFVRISSECGMLCGKGQGKMFEKVGAGWREVNVTGGRVCIVNS